MRRLLPLLFTLAPVTAFAAEPLHVSFAGLIEGTVKPEYAFCVPDAKKGSVPGRNVSPAMAWSKGPKETQSYAILVVDPDVPQTFDDANKKDKTLAADMPRQDFYHWALVNIPANVSRIPMGHGNAPAKIGRAGVNDYVRLKVVEPTPENVAKHTGYDGPCPPWNDARLHHYHFKVYALGVKKLDLPKSFTGKDAAAALAPHVLAEGEAVGTYTQNPKLPPQ